MFFTYGEREWVRGIDFEDVKSAASDTDDRGNTQVPEGRVNCTTGAQIQ